MTFGRVFSVHIDPLQFSRALFAQFLREPENESWAEKAHIARGHSPTWAARAARPRNAERTR